MGVVNPLRDLQLKQDSLNGFHRGQVEANDDPRKQGRIRIRVFPHFDSREIQTEDLPWAQPCWWTPMQIPPVNSWVWIFFENEDPAKIIYFGHALPVGPHYELPDNRYHLGDEAGKQHMDPETWFDETGSSYPRTVIYRSPNGNMSKMDDDTGEYGFWSKNRCRVNMAANGDLQLYAARDVLVMAGREIHFLDRQDPKHWMGPREFGRAGGPSGGGIGTPGGGVTVGPPQGDSGSSEPKEAGPDHKPSNSNTCYATYKDCIDKASTRYGVPRDVILATIQVESACNPAATSPTGARGLMQMTSGTARALGYTGDLGSPNGLTGMYDPCTNINYGTKLLRENYNRTGNWPDAIAIYYSGGTAAKDANGDYINVLGQSPSTQQHVDLWKAAWASIKADSTELDAVPSPTADGIQSENPVNMSSDNVGGFDFSTDENFSSVFQ